MSTAWKNIEDFGRKSSNRKHSFKKNLYSQNLLLERDNTEWKEICIIYCFDLKK